MSLANHVQIDPNNGRSASAEGPCIDFGRFTSLTDNVRVMQIVQAKEYLGFSGSVSTSCVNRINTLSGDLGALLELVDCLPRMELRRRFPREANALRGALDRFQRDRKHPVHADLHDLRNFLRVVLTDPNLGPHPGKPYSLDRIDPSRGYEAGNLKWSDKTEQSLNRLSTPVMATRDGKKPVSIVAKSRKKVTPATALRRVKRGWTPEEATSLPKGTRRASVQPVGAASATTATTRVTEAWEVWSATYRAEHGCPALRWGGKECGQMKHILATWEGTSTDPLAFLRYVVARWHLLMREHFAWMQSSGPPPLPDVGFIAAHLRRLHEAYFNALTLDRLDLHGPDGRYQKLRAMGLCNIAAEEIIQAERRLADIGRHATARAEKMEQHLAFLTKALERERAALRGNLMPNPHRSQPSPAPQAKPLDLAEFIPEPAPGRIAPVKMSKWI